MGRSRQVAQRVAEPAVEQLSDVLARAVEWARYEPVKFAREILQLKRLPGELAPGEKGYSPDNDWELDEWQCELLQAVADVARKHAGLTPLVNLFGKHLITVRACRGPGKTFGIGILAHTFGFAWDPMVIAVLAPKLDHIKTRFFGEFSKIAHRAIPGYTSLMDIGAQRVHWCVPDRMNHLLVAETAKQPENIQGLRRRFTLYLVDESSGVSENLWPVTDGNLSATEIGIRVQIGNPTRNTGHFAKSHLSAEVAQDYFRMHVKPTQSRRVKQSWIDLMIRSYGLNSPAVQVHCYGEFASADDRQLITIEWVAAAKVKEVDPAIGDGSLPRKRVSVDVMGGGEDETVCTAMLHFDAYRVGLKMTRHSFPAATAVNDTADAAEAMFKQFGFRKDVDDIVVDTNGVGLGVGGELHSRGYIVVFYYGGSKSDSPERWRNRRVQSHLCMRNDFRDGTIVLLDSFLATSRDWDDLDGQLCGIRMTTNERVEDLITKEEMKRQGMKSPDMDESLAMQYATQVPVATTMAMRAKPGAVVAPVEMLVQQSTVNSGLENF